MATRRKQMIKENQIIGHRERLSEGTPKGDAIVWTASNYTKMQKLAEMTNFNGKTLNIHAKTIDNKVFAWTYPSKLEDFWMFVN